MMRKPFKLVNKASNNKRNPININISLFLSKVEEKIFEINNTNNIED